MTRQMARSAMAVFYGHKVALTDLLFEITRNSVVTLGTSCILERSWKKTKRSLRAME